MSACHGRTSPAAPPRGTPVAWITTADGRDRLVAHSVLPMPTEGGQTIVVHVDTPTRLQPMTGFGAALTDASVVVLSRLAPAARDTLLQALFSPARGIGLSALRITIGASDFSRAHTTLDDMPAGTRDTALTHFSIDGDRRDKLPLLRQIRAINPQLTIVAAPWSAPAWMKGTEHLNGGTLRDDAMASYARYLVRAMQAYDAEGVHIDLLSVQNEPQHEPTDYPGMRLSSAQRARLVGVYLGPLMARAGVHTQLLEWDHNWDDPTEPFSVLGDSAARPFIHGVAWHCYAGDVSAQGMVHDRYPEVATYFTECSGGDWAANWGDNLLWNTRTLIIGATNNWARSVLLWNLALDERHGPHLGGCTNCRGVVTIDSATGQVSRNEEFYALAQASRFVRPGAMHVASTGGDGVSHVAFVNRDDASLVLVMANAQPTPVTVRITGARHPAVLTLPARSVASIILSR